MISFRKIISDYPLSFLLLPLFFVIHGWKENYYYVHFRDISILAAIFMLAAVIIFLISLLFFRNKIKAGIYTFILLAIYFFFGAVQDFLKDHSLTKEISRYKIILPLIFLLLIVSFIWLKKTKVPLQKMNSFLSVLMVIFIIVDIITIVALPAEKKERIKVANFPKSGEDCKDCNKPDIYFLLFDEYASSTALKQFWNYNNSGFDSALTARNFHIIRESQSNYNFTPFSMASILNMSYLSGIKDVNACTLEDYTMCDNLILNNGVTSYLRNNGYSFVNYSIFDINGAPSTVYQSFLPLKARLITEQTLFNRVKKDLGYLLLTGRFKIKSLADKFIYGGLHNNNYFLEKLKEEAGKKKDKPEFIYAHLYMPHPPFYFDSSGVERGINTLIQENYSIPVSAYLQYVGYTSKRILEVVDSILKNSSSPPVIIIMGDHGFRNCHQTEDRSCFFRNMNSVYLPDKNYNNFYDSLTGVNQFRILFNTIFHQNFPILKDSTILLTDKH